MGEILFLAHRVPFPPNRGDKIRSHHLLKALARVAPVHVATFAENAQDRAQEGALSDVAASYWMPDRSMPLPLAGIDALAHGKPVSLAAFDSRSTRQYVTRLMAERDIDTIFVFSGQMGQFVPATFKGRLIVDLCDVDSAKFEAYAAQPGRGWLYRREARLLAREEARLAQMADVTLLISPGEAALLRDRLPSDAAADIQVLRNGVDTAYFDPAAVSPHPALANGAHFVFTGQMDYQPNIEAAQSFASEVLPSVPGASFHVVGRAPTREVLALAARPGVTVWGEVDDVRPFLAGATAVVAPLKIARGVQNKVLEAMSMARPVLLTQAAATGIPAHDGQHFLIRDGAHELAKGAALLLGDKATAEGMGDAARVFVSKTMSWDAVYQQIADLVGRGQDARCAA